MQIEINQKAIPVEKVFGVGSGTLMITPPVGENYWLMRVVFSTGQAVVAFPKFGVIGCGFQIEKEDWNTNLPLSCPTNTILKHIWKNNGGNGLLPCEVAHAIDLLRNKCLQMGLVTQDEIEKIEERSRKFDESIERAKNFPA